MLQFTQELRSLVVSMNAAEFARQRVLCLAVEKLFINLGETATRVDAERARQMAGIPWRRVIGLRNILTHGYEQVAHEILFKTITDDLPALEDSLQTLLRDIINT